MRISSSLFAAESVSHIESSDFFTRPKCFAIKMRFFTIPLRIQPSGVRLTRIAATATVCFAFLSLS